MHFCHIPHEICDTLIEESSKGLSKPCFDATLSVIHAIEYWAKFLSRAALLGVAPTDLVTYSRAAIKSPGGYG